MSSPRAQLSLVRGARCRPTPHACASGLEPTRTVSTASCRSTRSCRSRMPPCSSNDLAPQHTPGRSHQHRPAASRACLITLTVWCRNATCPNCREELDWDALALLHRRKAKARRTRVLGSFVAKLTSTAQQAVSRTGKENAPPASQAQALPRRLYAPSWLGSHAPLAAARGVLEARRRARGGWLT